MEPKKDYGHIIFLNGTSSSGKTTLTGDLQARLDTPYEILSQDDSIMAMVAEYGVDLTKKVTMDDLKDVPLNQLYSRFHQSIATKASEGINLIVDTVIENEEWAKTLSGLLSDYDVALVGVHCPLDIIIKREKERKNRNSGLARAQFEIVHKQKKYDVEVDTSKQTPSDCAIQIIQYLQEGHNMNKETPTSQKFYSTAS